MIKKKWAEKIGVVFLEGNKTKYTVEDRANKCSRKLSKRQQIYSAEIRSPKLINGGVEKKKIK